MPGGILTLDLATSVTGWAYADPGGEPEWGEVTLKFDGETFRDHGGEIGARYALFLEARIEVFKPAYIVFESPYTGGGKIPVNHETMGALHGLALLTDTIAYQHGIDCRKEQTAVFIHSFTGQGRYPNRYAKKRATIKVCQLHGWKVRGDNEADALALLWYAETVLFPEMRLKMVRPAGSLFALDKSMTTRST